MGVISYVFELPIVLPSPKSRSLRRDLHIQLKAAIVDGRLVAGTALPPSRALAKSLGVSRNTVNVVYELLLSGGYVVARPGAGVFVAKTSERPRQRAESQVPRPWLRSLPPTWQAVSPARPAIGKILDFRPGIVDLTTLPLTIWHRMEYQALRALVRRPADYGSALGSRSLREAICRNVSCSRAIACEPEDVIVTAGAQQAFHLLAQILVRRGRTVVAVEEPGYPPIRNAFIAAGAIVKTVRVDEEGLIVSELPPNASVICVTPSHQFPLGAAMSPRRRAVLMEFIKSRDVVLLEDDYDSEFRFSIQPLVALKTLDDGERVFYIGTFSKVLFPGLRIGFIIAPSWASPTLASARQVTDGYGPVLNEETLAAFILGGHLRRHVRRMRKIYGARREQLLRSLMLRCSKWLDVLPSSAGLHLSTKFKREVNVDTLITECSRKELIIRSLSRYTYNRPCGNGLVFGYGGLAAEDVDLAVEELARLLERH